MTKIDELSFGSMITEVKKHGKDILVFAGGRVKKRTGGFLTFDSHEIKRQEIEELSQGRTEGAIVGIEPSALPIQHLS